MDRALDILELCEKAAIPFAPIVRPDELFEDPFLWLKTQFIEFCANRSFF